MAHRTLRLHPCAPWGLGPSSLTLNHSHKACSHHELFRREHCIQIIPNFSNQDLICAKMLGGRSKCSLAYLLWSLSCEAALLAASSTPLPACCPTHRSPNFKANLPLALSDRGESGWALADLGSGPWVGLGQMQGENDSRKETRITEAEGERNKQQKEGRKTVRNLLRWSFMTKLGCGGKGFSALLELTFKELTETEFKFGSRTRQLSKGSKALGP